MRTFWWWNRGGGDSNQPPTHIRLQRHVLLCCAVRNNDPWLCEPLVSKWLGWSPRIPDACCHRDKYATRRCPACHSPLLPPPPLGLHSYRNCWCCVFKLILWVQHCLVDMCVVVVVTVVTPVVLREIGGPLDKSLVRRMRHSHPADGRVNTRSPACPVRFPPKLICPGPLSKPPPRGFLQSRKFTYFHLISRQYEMGSHERAWFTLQQGALCKRDPLIEASPVSLWYQVSSWSPHLYAGLFVLSERTSHRGGMYVHFMASVCFWPWPTQSCVPYTARRGSGSLSVWKVEGKEAFSWSESAANRALSPARLFCKWIRSTGFYPGGSNSPR